MDDNAKLLRELQEVRRTATRLSRFAAGMQVCTVGPVEREDHSGAIDVRVGNDGMPDRIRVAEDWQRRLSAGEVGQAVVEAYGLAMRVRMEAWAAELESTPVDDDEFDPAMDEEREAAPAKPPAEMLSIGELAEEAIGLLESVGDADPPAQTPSEVGPARRAVIDLSGGRLNSCEIDVRWARRQSARSLAGALNSALHRARVDSASEADARETSRRAQRQQAQDLFNGALAAMKDPDRLTE